MKLIAITFVYFGLLVCCGGASFTPLSLVKRSKLLLRIKRLASLLFTERRCSSQLMGMFSFRQGLARKGKIMKIILIVKI